MFGDYNTFYALVNWIFGFIAKLDFFPKTFPTGDVAMYLLTVD